MLRGCVAARSGWLSLDAISGLNLFVLHFALPCWPFRLGVATPIARTLDPRIIGTCLLCALVMVGISVTTTR